MSNLPPKTQLLLELVLPRNLAAMVHEYMLLPYEFVYRSSDAGFAGHWELVMEYGPQFSSYIWSRTSWECVMHGACFGGHEQIVDLAIRNGAHDWIYGLSGACRGNHHNLVKK
jgi:hypothetical protein